MSRILVALYKNDMETARQVVDALLEAGFSADDIRLLLNESLQVKRDSGQISVTECAGLGALVGALVGVGSSLVPDIGPALGIGAVGVALTTGIGAAVGAITGGITAGLIDVEPDENTLPAIAEQLSGDAALVYLTTHEQWLEWAEKIMLRYQPLKIEGRAADGYSSPWVAIIREPNDSQRMSTLSADSSTTKMRQLDSNLKLRGRVQVYEYRN